MKQPLARIAILVVTIVVVSNVYTTEPPQWSGWYAGIFGGYMDGKLTTNDPSHFETTGEFDDNSPIAGIHGGINKLLENGWLIGGELIIPLYLEDGSAVDTEFFPDEDPRVIYEAHHNWSVLAGVKVGKPIGKVLPYFFGAIGLANSDGKTINLNNDNIYSPGSEQSATATHFVYQIGVGGDYKVNQSIFMGLRVLAFNSNKKPYEMPWDEFSPGADQWEFSILDW
jgi:opacity protein-like surface antigen